MTRQEANALVPDNRAGWERWATARDRDVEGSAFDLGRGDSGNGQ